MTEKNDENFEKAKRTRFFWAILIAVLVIGGQIAFLIALSML